MNTFSTFDLGLATVLITLGYKLIKLDKNNPKKSFINGIIAKAMFGHASLIAKIIGGAIALFLR